MIDFETYKVEPDDKVQVIGISGQLDTASCEYFFSCIEDEIKRGNVDLIIDCRNLEFLSSMGLAMMIRVHSRMKKLGGNVKLARVEGTVADVIRTVHLDKVLELYPTVREAREGF